MGPVNDACPVAAPLKAQSFPDSSYTVKKLPGLIVSTSPIVAAEIKGNAPIMHGVGILHVGHDASRLCASLCIECVLLCLIPQTVGDLDDQPLSLALVYE